MQSSIYSFILVGLGGALGAMSRYALTVLSSHYYSLALIGTFLSNVIGCFLMGIIFQLVFNFSSESATNILVEQNRLLFAVGFCGSFTTLSALIVEINNLHLADQYLQSLMYLFGTLIAAFLFFIMGMMLVDYITQSYK